MCSNGNNQLCVERAGQSILLIMAAFFFTHGRWMQAEPGALALQGKARYQHLCDLACGSCSVVILAVDKSNGELVSETSAVWPLPPVVVALAVTCWMLIKLLEHSVETPFSLVDFPPEPPAAFAGCNQALEEATHCCADSTGDH